MAFCHSGEGAVGEGTSLWGCAAPDCLGDLEAVPSLGTSFLLGCGGQVPLGLRSTQLDFGHSSHLWGAELTAPFLGLACTCKYAHVSEKVLCMPACTHVGRCVPTLQSSWPPDILSQLAWLWV